MTPYLAQADGQAQKPTTRDWALRWQDELNAADREVRSWHERAKEIIKRYRVDSERQSDTPGAQINIFTVNVQTQLGLLYGRVPQVGVDRTFADASDDVARVGGELLERLLNADIERTGDTYAEALGEALLDRLLAGLGTVRVRYEVKMEQVKATPPVLAPDGRMLAPGMPAYERKVYECADTDYVHWKDFRWSPARTWSQVRWVAFAADMTEAQLVERFGAEVAAVVPMSSPTNKEREDGQKDIWARARVWEIWDSQSKRVYWWAAGAGACLDIEDDPLRLKRFFPCPRPLLATTTTDSLLPTPDFDLARYLYEEVDCLTQRIALLIEAVRVAGVYDGSSDQVKRLLSTRRENVLIAVDSWAMFAEKGGLRGVVDWFPLEQVVNALTVLNQQREITLGLLDKATGFSDLLRGQSATTGVTATEVALEAKFGSVRLKKLQDEFARFASEVQQLKAEVIANLYSPETIIEKANARYMPESPALLQEAVGLIKSGKAEYRVVVKPEAVSMQDFAQIRAERTELLQGVTQFMTAMAPVAQGLPGSLPFLLQILQWFVAGLRGSSQIEGVLDQAIQSARQMASQPQQGQQPDMSKVMAEQAKTQGALAKVEAESRARLTEIQAEVVADRQREENQMQFNVQEAAQKALISRTMRPDKQGSGEVP